MAKRLLERYPAIDAFVSSPAKRAKKTAEFFAAAYGQSAEDLMLITALYQADAEVFYEVIAALPDKLKTIALFSHNPGITYFINDMNTGTQLDNMPTCGIFAVQVGIAHWSGFAKAKKELLLFDYPKLAL